MINIEDKVKDTQNTINTASSKFENRTLKVPIDIATDANNIINEAREKLVGLNIDLYDYCFEDAEFYFRNKKTLNNLKEKLNRLLSVIKNSNSFYRTVKSSYVELEYEVYNYVEIVEDMETRHENKPEDQRISELLKDI